MTEHPTKQELDEYCRRVLSAAAFLSVHRHVTACPRCAAKCNSRQDLERDLVHLHEALISVPDETPYHLSTAEMTAYVQGTLDAIDLEIAETHLEICTTCHTEVQRQKAEGQPVAPVHMNAAASKPRQWASLPFINRWQPMRIAVAVLLVAMPIFLTVWLLRSRPAVHEESVGPANMSSPQSSSTAEAKSSNMPELQPNDVAAPDGPLQTKHNSQFAMVINDGDRKVSMDRRGRLVGLERLPVQIQEKVGTALQAGRLEQPAALAQLASQPSTLLSESGDGLPFRLIEPLGQVVRNQQPTFRWHALPGAQSYKVIVTDVDLNEVEASRPLNTSEWRITKPLRPGGIYSWQVTALKDGAAITSPVLPAPQAKFKVMDFPTARMLQQAERAYPDSHLTLGVLYAEAGLLDEAEQKLRVLVRNNPQVRIAHKLLQSIQAIRATRNASPGGP